MADFASPVLGIVWVELLGFLWPERLGDKRDGPTTGCRRRMGRSAGLSDTPATATVDDLAPSNGGVGRRLARRVEKFPVAKLPQRRLEI